MRQELSLTAKVNFLYRGLPCETIYRATLVAQTLPTTEQKGTQFAGYLKELRRKIVLATTDKEAREVIIDAKMNGEGINNLTESLLLEIVYSLMDQKKEYYDYIMEENDFRYFSKYEAADSWFHDRYLGICLCRECEKLTSSNWWGKAVGKVKMNLMKQDFIDPND